MNMHFYGLSEIKIDDHRCYENAFSNDS